MSDTMTDTKLATLTGNITVATGLTCRRGTRKSTWSLRTVVDGKRSSVQLGTWPHLSVADAIDRAASIQRGDQQEPVWGDMLEQFVIHHPKPSNQETLRQVQIHFGSLLATRPSSITNAQVFRLEESLTLSSSTRLKLFAFANRAGKWAVARGLSTNPVSALMDYNATQRGDSKRMRQSDFRDRSMTVEVIKSTVARLKRTDDTDAFLLCLSTGLRKDELRLLQCSEVNTIAGTITIPAERRKNRKALVLPISPLVSRLLEGRTESGTHVFPKIAAESPSAWSNRLKTASKGHTPHDIRRTTAHILRDLGIGAPVVAKILGHSDQTAGPSSTNLYMGSDKVTTVQEQSQALGMLSDFISSQVL